MNDETAEVVFDFHPYYLGIHPRDSISVFVGGYHSDTSIEDPTTKLEVDTRRPATKRAWIEAVIEISEEFHEVIVDTNPDLYDELDWFREKLDEVRDMSNEYDMPK